MNEPSPADPLEWGVRPRLFPVTFVIAVVVILGVIVATAVSLVSERRHTREAAVNDIKAVADLKSAEVSRWFHERWGDAERLSQTSLELDEILDLVTRPDEADLGLIHYWMSSFRSAYGYSAVVVFDPEGKAVLSDGLAPMPISAAAVTTAIQRQEVGLADFDADDDSGRRQLAFLAPITRGPAGTARRTTVGLVALVVDARKALYPMLARWPFTAGTAETILIRRDGSDLLLLSDPQQARDGGGLFRVPLSTPDLAFGGRDAFGPEEREGLDYANRQVLAVVRPVADTPWVLVAEQQLSEVYQPFWQTLRLQGVIALLVMATTVLGLAAVSRHVTLRSLESALVVRREQMDSHERLQAAMRASLDAFAILDARGRVLDWNRQAVQTFGLSREQALGRAFAHLALASPFDEQYANAMATFAAGDEHPLLRTRATISARRDDGREFPAEVTVVPVRLHSQVTFSVAVRDITDRVAAETEIRAAQQETQDLLQDAERARRALLNIVEDQRRTEAALRDSENMLDLRVRQRTAQLEAANRELEAFSYSVSHDLRAPLRAIDGYTRMLEEDFGTALDADGQRRLSVVQREAKRMGALIDDLLRLSRVGRQPLQADRVDMTALVTDAWAELTRDLGDREVDLVLHTLPDATGDSGVIRQVWMNLLSNALKFTATRARPAIEVGVIGEPNGPVYFVRDNGVGFDMRYADQLFGVFHRLHSAAEFEGTGVGLALVQRIIVRHGGRIWVNAAVNEGASFFFTVPGAGVPA